MSSLRCVECKLYLFHEPMQCPCGDRVCSSCYENYRSSNKTKIICPGCQTDFLLSDCFRDRAATMELKKATIQCQSPGCLWEGKSERYEDHIRTCQFAVIPCPFSAYGCDERLSREEMNVHEAKCSFKLVRCEWCKETVSDEMLHLESDCQMFPRFCVNGCGKKISKRDAHFATCREKVPTSATSTSPPKSCEFVYEKTSHPKFSAAELEGGYDDDHTSGNYYHSFTAANGYRESRSSDVNAGEIVAGTQQNSDLNSEVSREVSRQLQPMATVVAKNESAIQHLYQADLRQATIYDGKYLWKIPDIRRRAHETKTGETVSLHSQFFYTSQYGYKMCLRLYLNGDGTGKGTHLSFFFIVMKGEYDEILPWPFELPVTLMLLDQDKEVVKKNIVQTFKPTPDTSSFQQPKSEMNVASGCPKFAPLALLDNPSYVKDDIMFLKCKIDTSALCD